MDVNYEVWGAPETWVDGDTTQQKAGIKFAAGTQDTYRELYTTGKLELNEMDLSASYWGIGKGSIFNMPHYLSPYQLDGETEVAVDAAAENISRPMILSSNNFAANQYIRFSERYAPDTTEAVGSTLMSYTGKVILNYNYQNLFVVPYITCKASGYASGTTTTTLYSYIETEMYNTKPEVIAIAFLASFGDGSESRSNSTIGIISDVHFPGSDLYYGSNQFWSKSGCSILYNTTESDDINILGCLHNTTTAINNTVGDRTTALAYKYSKAASSSVPIYYFDPDNDIWTINKTGVYRNVTYWYEYPYINVTSADMATRLKDYVLSQIAYLGFPFVYDPETVKTGKIGDVGVYLPKFDEDGITTGEYAEGAAALALPNAEWIDGRESGYDPTKPPTPPEDEDIGDLENSTYGNYGYTGGNKLYSLTQTEVDTFMSTINAYYTPASGDTPEDIQNKKDRLQLDFKGSNPFNYIVGLYALPIYVGYTEEGTINLGPVDTGVTARRIDPSASRHFEFGSYTISRKYNDFRDYAPYTSIELYIPLCGTVQLDPADVMGHTIRVDALFDLQTGDLTARVLRDKLEGGISTQWTMIDTVQGNLFVSIPVTADDMGNFQNRQHFIKASMISKAVNFLGGTANTVYNDASSVAGAVAGTGGSPHLTSPFSFLTSGFNAGMGIGLGRYQLTHSPLTPYQVSTASSAIGFNMYPRAKIFIKRPLMLSGYDQGTYAHTVGNATCENTTVGTTVSGNTRAGLVVCSDVDLSGLQTATAEHPATLEEQRMIKQALTTGVYV